MVNLDVGRSIAELPLPRMPHLGSGISWQRGGRRVMTAPHLRDGRQAPVSLGEDDGARIVYGAEALEEVRRLPMRKPSEKCNVWNKITFSDGASHGTFPI